MFKSIMLATVTSALLIGVVPSVTFAQTTVREEFNEHPRIKAAVRELQEAINYMEKAPHNFGGHKGKAIADARAAIRELTAAMAYRAKVENSRK